MPTITALRRKRPGQVQVELDGVPWRSIPDDAVLAAGLHIGAALDRPRLREIRRVVRGAEARAVALRALRRRDLSAHELEERLRRHRIAPRERADTLGALVGAGVVADDRLAELRARGLAARGLGDEAIRHDLRRRHIAEDVVAAAISGLDPEVERARKLAASLGGGANAARSLARKGFSDEAVEASVPDAIAESP